jgi:hypothetical protein
MDDNIWYIILTKLIKLSVIDIIRLRKCCHQLLDVCNYVLSKNLNYKLNYYHKNLPWEVENLIYYNDMYFFTNIPAIIAIHHHQFAIGINGFTYEVKIFNDIHIEIDYFIATLIYSLINDNILIDSCYKIGRYYIDKNRGISTIGLFRNHIINILNVSDDDYIGNINIKFVNNNFIIN